MSSKRNITVPPYWSFARNLVFDGPAITIKWGIVDSLEFDLGIFLHQLTESLVCDINFMASEQELVCSEGQRCWVVRPMLFVPTEKMQKCQGKLQNATPNLLTLHPYHADNKRVWVATCHLVPINEVYLQLRYRHGVLWQGQLCQRRLSWSIFGYAGISS